MTPGKTTDRNVPRSATTTTATNIGTSSRKPWKKKSPVEVVLDQINKVREDVAEKEEALKIATRQLEKLEAARKVLEAT